MNEQQQNAIKELSKLFMQIIVKFIHFVKQKRNEKKKQMEFTYIE